MWLRGAIPLNENKASNQGAIITIFRLLPMKHKCIGNLYVYIHFEFNHCSKSRIIHRLGRSRSGASKIRAPHTDLLFLVPS